MAVAAPSDRRFRRSHVKPARRRNGLLARRWRTAVTVVVVGLALYAGRRAVSIVAGLEIFHVDRINVRGNHRLSSGEVMSLVADLRGRSILSIDLDQWRTALLVSPWVADASLRRTLPSTVDIVVLERTPLGIGRINGSLYLVDDRGSVIDEYGPNYADLDLPIIDGLSGVPDEETTNLYRALLARRLLDALKVQNLAGRISQIDVSDSRNAVVLVDDDPTQLRLGAERFVERLQSYFELAPALREQVPAMDYVDLRFDERVYVRPAKDRPPAARKAPAKTGRTTTG
jgi:cell division protein FtsQ